MEWVDHIMEQLKKVMPKWLTTKITYIYFIFMLVIFPFVFTNGMFRLHLDKRDAFLVFSAVYLCMLFPSVLVALYDWGNDMYAPKKPDIIFALILLSALIVSTIFALNPRRALFEVSSRTISGLCVLCAIFIFFAVRQYGKADKILQGAWIAGSSGIYLFGILCACGINVMHIQDGLTSSQLQKYLTPLSNTNYNTCYVCLMLPPVMVMYMICEKRLSRILCGINLYLGFLFIFFIKTDSSIVAILLGFILLGYFALEKDSWAMHYIWTVGIYLCAKLTICTLLRLFPERLYPFHGLFPFLLKNRLVLYEILCYLAFFMIWKWKKEFFRKVLASARKALVIIALSFAFVCIVCIIFANINAKNLTAESFWNFLVIKDSTFTRRGFIWKKTVSLLKTESIGRKLIGNGLNSFWALMRIVLSLPTNKIYEDPHNEFLQMAVDMGLFGLIGYFGLLFSSLFKGLCNWKKNNFHIITVLTLSVYMIQALANEYSIFTLPLVFIFLGLVNSPQNQKDVCGTY